jgi:hypothetical protein
VCRDEWRLTLRWSRATVQQRHLQFRAQLRAGKMVDEIAASSTGSRSAISCLGHSCISHEASALACAGMQTTCGDTTSSDSPPEPILGCSVDGMAVRLLVEANSGLASPGRNSTRTSRLVQDARPSAFHKYGELVSLAAIGCRAIVEARWWVREALLKPRREQSQASSAR